MTSIPRILITPGEPAGIGPDITLAIAKRSWEAEICVVSDETLLLQRAELLKRPIQLYPFQEQSPRMHIPDSLSLISVPLNNACNAGTLNIQNAAYVLDCLKTASSLCLEKKVDALVTGPVNKAHLNHAGITFSGHTEWLAQYCHAEHTVMLFVVNHIKVALLTTHIPLSQVANVVTKERLVKTISLLNKELKIKFGIAQPRISVCGLNPHAGESGHLGKEEIEIIAPAISELQKQGIQVRGPIPADTAFTENNLADCDVVLAMYHDQGLPVVKQMGFYDAVNVTLGLPIIRTSVDHGTALALAGTGKADSRSLEKAIELAIHLSLQKM